MRDRLLDLLRCPECSGQFDLEKIELSGDETSTGVLSCDDRHFYPVVGGIPRMLPNSLREHWPFMKAVLAGRKPRVLASLLKGESSENGNDAYDLRTKQNFSKEWDNHDIGGKTWGMELSDRIQWFFLDSIRIPKEDLNGKIMLDAGCGNGSQSVAYTRFGLEVIALDLSTGVEKGAAFRKVFKSGRSENVHFVQGDLQRPPLAAGSFDIIHSAGVLHHTPNTKNTFRALTPLLKENGTFYAWLYKYEKIVTPIVNSMRSITPRVPSPVFAGIANAAAMPFIWFCWTINKLGIRKYETLNRREAVIAVHDIFGAPYAHYHDFEEVSRWFRLAGFGEIWACNDDRRGFGVCGRL